MGSDLGNLFRADRATRQAKRNSNLKRSLKALESSGINYQKLSEHHYLVANNYDYWPSTGLFINRSTQKRGRGIFKIIAKCRSLRPINND
jgi:hypothetical protein